MISLICGIYSIIQMNISIQKKKKGNWLTNIENRLVVAKRTRGGEGWIGILRLVDANYCIENV